MPTRPPDQDVYKDDDVHVCTGRDRVGTALNPLGSRSRTDGTLRPAAAAFAVGGAVGRIVVQHLERLVWTVFANILRLFAALVPVLPVRRLSDSSSSSPSASSSPSSSASASAISGRPTVSPSGTVNHDDCESWSGGDAKMAASADLTVRPLGSASPSTTTITTSVSAAAAAATVWSRTVWTAAAGCVPSMGYFAAGGLAGMVSRTVTAPLDRLKVHLIAQTRSTTPAASMGRPDMTGSSSVLGHLTSRMNPFIVAGRELWAAGGIRSLFVGNGLNVVKIMPESAIKFGSYEGTKRILAQMQGLSDPMELGSAFRFLAGGISGIISQCSVYPVDTVKFRMQCETVPGGPQGIQLIANTVQTMYVRGGLASFYRGLTMGIVGMFPYAAIDLGMFEFLKRAARARKASATGCADADVTLSSFTTAAIGGTSGAIGACSVYPLNVLRTRLQSQGTAAHPRTYTGAIDVAVQTVQGEGIKGLYRGLTPNLLKVVPAVSITYVVYEKSKQMLRLD